MPIDYTKRPKQGAPQPPVPVADQQAPGAPSTPAASAPSGPVVLTKAAPSVSLTKQGSVGGTMRVNLNWNARSSAPPQPQGGGLLRRFLAGASAGTAIDLDLGCLYEYSDGSKGVVQALGNTFRDQHGLGRDPICWLDGDDRSGASAGGENLYVNLGQRDAIRRVLVFAFIYSGVPSWAEADGVVTLMPASGPHVQIRLDEHDARSVMCAIAMIENSGGELSVRREVRYVQGGHRALDEAYGWGLRWAAGRK